MKSIIQWSILNIMIIFLIACTNSSALRKQDKSGDASEAMVGTLMLFSETHPGMESSEIQIFVNKGFLRIIDSSLPQDYILYDRKKRSIYNVVADEKTILEISPTGKISNPTIPIDFRFEKEKSSMLTKRQGGGQAYYYQYFANENKCYNAISVENYQDDVVEAFKEFKSVLAHEHAKTILSIPNDQLDPCDLAINIFEPVKYLEFGFPVREWDSKGYQRFLIEMKERIMPPEDWFNLPEEYTRYAISSDKTDNIQ